MGLANEAIAGGGTSERNLRGRMWIDDEVCAHDVRRVSFNVDGDARIICQYHTMHCVMNDDTLYIHLCFTCLLECDYIKDAGFLDDKKRHVFGSSFLSVT